MAIKINGTTVIDDSQNWTGAAVPASKGGTGLSTPGSAGSVLLSNGTTWTAGSVDSLSAVKVTGTTQLAAKSNRYFLVNVGTTTVTLPAAPAEGDIVAVTVMNGLTSNIIARNGNSIMGVLEDVIIDNANGSVNLIFMNGTWKIFSGVGEGGGSASLVTVSNGGTGLTSLPANSLLVGNGISPVQSISPGTAGNTLVSNGTSWVSQSGAISGSDSYKFFSAF